MSPEFLFTAFIVCAMPGIGVIYTLSTTLGAGLRAGLLAVLGCTLTTAIHLLFTLGGLAAVLHTSALFFLAFLPQFIPAGAPDATLRLTELGLGFVAMTFAVFVGYAVLAGSLRRAVLARPRVMAWIRRAFAASFAGLGLRLALERA
ncbi:LysE family translocator [Acidimangrovimonas pyrenivorans]|uniref:LysE family translocator n=1 Tax=Acidimangrovimonas pyrenivorans TaxID=2030798 RepID=A0ABV7AJI8_9RHOB